MASWIHSRLWVLVGILLAFGCQRYDDQPDANPVPAPALGDITIQLNDSGKGDLPTPLVKDLRDGALTLHLTKPRHGEIVADLQAGRVIYTAHDDFRGTDTANYTLKRGNSATSGLVLVKISDRSCLTIARDDEYTLQVPFQRDYPLQIKENDKFCPGSKVLAVLNGQTFFRVDDEGQMIFNTPPGFNGTATGEYELVSSSGYRSRARITVYVLGCNQGLTAHDDSVRIPFASTSSIDVNQLLHNDSACPDSLDPKSLIVYDHSSEVYVLDYDTSSFPLQLSCSVVPQDSLQSNRTFYLKYRVWTRSRSRSSDATVFIRRRP